MTSKIITGQNWRLGPWVCERARCGDWVPGRGECIGLEKGGEILAVALYEAYNGVSIMIHLAAVPGRRWLNREYLLFCFHYPFNQLSCKTLLTVIPSVNTDAIKFDEHIGWTYKATLEDAHPDGDLLVYQMRRQDCRWLSLRSRNVLDNRASPAPDQV